MLSKVQITLIKTDKERDEVTAFAATFDHDLTDPSFWKHPMFAVRNREGNLIGFYQQKTVPIVFSGWHPSIKPVEFIEAKERIQAHDTIDAELNGRDNGYVAINLNHKTFTPEMMQKFDYERVGVELYQRKK